MWGFLGIFEFFKIVINVLQKDAHGLRHSEGCFGIIFSVKVKTQVFEPTRKT